MAGRHPDDKRSKDSTAEATASAVPASSAPAGGAGRGDNIPPRREPNPLYGVSSAKAQRSIDIEKLVQWVNAQTKNEEMPWKGSDITRREDSATFPTLPTARRGRGLETRASTRRIDLAEGIAADADSDTATTAPSDYVPYSADQPPYEGGGKSLKALQDWVNHKSLNEGSFRYEEATTGFGLAIERTTARAGPLDQDASNLQRDFSIIAIRFARAAIDLPLGISDEKRSALASKIEAYTHAFIATLEGYKDDIAPEKAAEISRDALHDFQGLLVNVTIETLKEEPNELNKAAGVTADNIAERRKQINKSQSTAGMLDPDDLIPIHIEEELESEYTKELGSAADIIAWRDEVNTQVRVSWIPAKKHDPAGGAGGEPDDTTPLKVIRVAEPIVSELSNALKEEYQKIHDTKKPEWFAALSPRLQAELKESIPHRTVHESDTTKRQWANFTRHIPTVLAKFPGVRNYVRTHIYVYNADTGGLLRHETQMRHGTPSAWGLNPGEERSTATTLNLEQIIRDKIHDYIKQRGEEPAKTLNEAITQASLLFEETFDLGADEGPRNSDETIAFPNLLLSLLNYIPSEMYASHEMHADNNTRMNNDVFTALEALSNKAPYDRLLSIVTQVGVQDINERADGTNQSKVFGKDRKGDTESKAVTEETASTTGDDPFDNRESLKAEALLKDEKAGMAMIALIDQMPRPDSKPDRKLVAKARLTKLYALRQALVTVMTAPEWLLPTKNRSMLIGVKVICCVLKKAVYSS